ncbi:MAG: 3-oxocholest-4-en-26-oate--CoA ligase [Acidimicrobiales bacterium]|nr:MAG: acyl-CoA synthetase [Actinomycetota bacterium]MBV6508271.1 3-oxocholest-4-en-26-oate--CoA ligase [Acidimicrobiales bacterium]RIK07341.1 MAG: acyl-CoA synthetase [Acidobacteriota bacterium]
MELNLPALLEAVAATIPDRESLRFGDRRFTWAQTTERTRRLASVLLSHGLTIKGDHDAAEPWQSVHDHVALYLFNGNEYLECMLGAYKARCAPFNVNYRYVADELRYVLADAAARAVVYHGAFAPTLAEVLDDLPDLGLLLQVDDGSGNELLPGALDYESALRAASPRLPDELVASWSPDDLYILYTGGTTGMPKGVLWRQADFLVSALGVLPESEEISSIDEIVAKAGRGRVRALPAPPFMHGAAHWNAISAWVAGGTVIIQSNPTSFDAEDVLAAAAQHHATSLLVVGDPMARPLLDSLESSDHDLTSLRHVLSGGAVLSDETKRRLTRALPGVTVIDVLGSSESGRQAIGMTHESADSGFVPGPNTAVLDESRTRPLRPGDPQLGWLAKHGRVPLGYLGDPGKTAATFPVIGGVRYAVAGDRARLRPDGSIELHGRESATVNTGGEKVFVEEVESALKRHPAIHDAVVVGRPSGRWGEEVVAIVSLRPGASASDASLQATCAETLAGFKVPKAFIRLPEVLRSPAGKADYRWALEVAKKDLQ